MSEENHKDDSRNEATPGPALTDLTVVYAGEDWWVLNKPVGWHSVAAPRSDGGPSVQDWLDAHHPLAHPLPEAGIVHRLDVSTSGCLVVARTPDAYARLREAFSSEISSRVAGGVEKRYLALVEKGLPLVGHFELYFSSRYKGSHKVTVKPQGKPGERGRCRWKVLERPSRDPEGELVAVWLLGAGRRHQIRAGLASMGYPLIGDSMYRGFPDPRFTLGAALHAWSVVVEDIEVVAPPPEWGARAVFE